MSQQVFEIFPNSITGTNNTAQNDISLIAHSFTNPDNGRFVPTNTGSEWFVRVSYPTVSIPQGHYITRLRMRMHFYMVQNSSEPRVSLTTLTTQNGVNLDSQIPTTWTLNANPFSNSFREIDVSKLESRQQLSGIGYQVTGRIDSVAPANWAELASVSMEVTTEPIPARQIGIGSTWQAWKPSNHGVWESNAGNLYALARINNDIVILKSSNKGISWVETHILENTHISSANVYNNQIWLRATDGFSLRRRAFSMDTDSLIHSSNTTFASTFISNDISNQTAFISTLINSDSLETVLFTGTTDSVMGTAYRRIRMRRSNGSTVVFPNPLPTTTCHYDLRGAVEGSNNRTHVFFTRSDQTTNLQHVCIRADGTQSAIQSIGSLSDNLHIKKYPFSFSSNILSDGRHIINILSYTGTGNAKRLNTRSFLSGETLTESVEGNFSFNVPLLQDNDSTNIGWINYSDDKPYYFYIRSDNAIGCFDRSSIFSGTEFLTIYPNKGLIEGFSANTVINGDIHYMYQANNGGVVSLHSGILEVGSPNTNPQSPPIVSVVEVDRLKISNEEGMDLATAIIKFDVDVDEYKVNVLGVSHDTGNTIIYETDGVPANMEIEIYIHWTNLYQEGENRINIYGKNNAGWTTYSQ